jgi:transcriptional regulator with XRE-family HTH domain
MTKTLAPEVRLQFAKRLKSMRTDNGFQRARYFAKSLGIEENRYTRYERAEVEPSLTLIHKMCEVLRVSPNELLGFPEPRGQPGFGESPQADLGPPDTPPERHGELLAWRLATEVVAVRNAHRSRGTEPGDPLAATRETGKLFQQLRRDPFNTIAGIVADEALKSLDAERKAELARLVEAFTEAAGRAPSSSGSRR